MKHSSFPHVLLCDPACNPLMTLLSTAVHSSPQLTLQSTDDLVAHSCPQHSTADPSVHSCIHQPLTADRFLRACSTDRNLLRPGRNNNDTIRIHSIYKELKSFETNYFKIMNGYLYWFNFMHEAYQICISTYTNQYMIEIDMDQRILVYIYNFTNFVNSWTLISLPSDDWPSCCSCSGSETTIRNQPGCWHLSARPGSTYTPDRRNSSNKAKWQVLSWLRNNNYNILILMTLIITFIETKLSIAIVKCKLLMAWYNMPANNWSIRLVSIANRTKKNSKIINKTGISAIL